jgi:DNA polymerase III alpha subunit (gram-positive type)
MRGSKLTIVYDLETSGFKCMPMFSEYHRVLQICARCIETNQTFSSFVNPGFKGGVPSYSAHIHHITQSDVKKAPPMEEVLRMMFKFFNFPFYDSVEMIAHNNTFFDELMIMKEYKTVPGEFVPDNVIFWDTLPWLRANRTIHSYRLEDVYKYFYGEGFADAHRADADVTALTRIYMDHIAPNRRDEPTREELEMKVIEKECLTSIRFIGEWRSVLMYTHAYIETVSQLKKFANSFVLKGENVGFDCWLKEKIGMKDVTSRMFVLSNVYDIPIWSDAIFGFLDLRHCDEDCLSEVDYYIKYRYVLNERAPNRHLYERGLMKMFKRIDH